MRKKLIFFLYIGNDKSPQERISAGIAAKIHFGCLKKWRYVFDEAKFILSVKKEQIGNTELISEYVRFIMDLGYVENTEFVIEENTEFREAKVFKYEIVDNGENEGRLVFFSHLRGEFMDDENMGRWIFSNYFYALTNEWELNYWLIEYNKIFYGFPLADARRVIEQPCELLPYYRYLYIGSIYWTNVSLFREYVHNKQRKIPEVNNRFYSEHLPGNVVEYEMTATANYVSVPSGIDMYTEYDKILTDWSNASGRSLDDFNAEYDKMKNQGMNP